MAPHLKVKVFSRTCVPPSLTAHFILSWMWLYLAYYFPIVLIQSIAYICKNELNLKFNLSRTLLSSIITFISLKIVARVSIIQYQIVHILILNETFEHLTYLGRLWLREV